MDAEVKLLDLEAFIGVQMSLGATSSEITNSKFELNSNLKMQEIISKTKQKQELSQEQIDFVDSQMKSVRYLNDTFLQPALAQKYSDFLPDQLKPHAELILKCLRGHSQ